MNRLKFRQKQRIAHEAAKILVEEGIDNFQLAKQKAAKRLRYGPAQPMPGDDEIEHAIGEYHRLFRSEIQGPHIDSLRKTALKAMIFLKNFSPRLVGNVVDGSAGRHSPAVIYLMADNPESVLICFLDARIPFVETSRRHLIAGRKTEYPAIEFRIDGVKIEAHILSETAYRESFQNRKSSTPHATIDSIRSILNTKGSRERI